MAKPTGWVPRQHGAWAMLAVPALLGIAARLRWGGDGGPATYLISLVAAWFAGYFWFSAASLWLKSAPRRRRPLLAPLATYGALAAGLGAAVLVLVGPSLLLWGIVFVPLTALALVLVAHRRERSLLSGAATVIAASAFLVTCYLPSPTSSAPRLGDAIWLAGVCLAYFLGTVFAVKTMIRERGSQGWFAASVGYHAACVGFAVVGLATGALSWVWIGFFAAATIRAAALPLIARRRGALRPGTLGIIEIGFTLALVALAFATQLGR